MATFLCLMVFCAGVLVGWWARWPAVSKAKAAGAAATKSAEAWQQQALAWKAENARLKRGFRKVKGGER